MKYSTKLVQKGFHVYYIWTLDHLLNIDCAQDHFDMWISRDAINGEGNRQISKTEDLIVLTLPVITAFSENYCVRVLNNGNYWIGKLTGYCNIFKVLDIPPGKKVIAVKAIKGDSF